jgi:hypothetical protein
MFFLQWEYNSEQTLNCNRGTHIYYSATNFPLWCYRSEICSALGNEYFMFTRLY